MIRAFFLEVSTSASPRPKRATGFALLKPWLPSRILHTAQPRAFCRYRGISNEDQATLRWACQFWTVLLLTSLTLGANAAVWETNTGYRFARLSVPSSRKTGFALLPGAATGIAFTNTLTVERKKANANLMNGSGVALGDYDGDGL